MAVIRLRCGRAGPQPGHGAGGVGRPQPDQPVEGVGDLGVGGQRRHLALPQIEVAARQVLHIGRIRHRSSIVADDSGDQIAPSRSGRPRIALRKPVARRNIFAAQGGVKMV
jgi:hypothetical protein